MLFDSFTTKTKPDPFGRLGFGDTVTDDADGGDGFIGALRDTWPDTKAIFSGDDTYVSKKQQQDNDPYLISEFATSTGNTGSSDDGCFGSAPRKQAKSKSNGGLFDYIVNVIDDSFGYEVGRNKTNRRRDVAPVETLLHGNGYYNLDKTAGPTGYFSNGLEDAIETFQADKGLKKDGYLEPKGDTITSLIGSLSQAAARGVGSLFSSVFSGLGSAADAVGDTVSSAARDVTNAGGSLLHGLGDDISDAADSIDSTISGWFGEDKTNDNKVITTDGAITRSSAQAIDLPPLGAVQKNKAAATEPVDFGQLVQSIADETSQNNFDLSSGKNNSFDNLIRKVADEGKQTILVGVDDKEIKDLVIKHEKDVPYLYKDSLGNITVGTGIMLPSVQEAQKLPFEIKQEDGTVRPATSNEIKTVFDKVKATTGNVDTDYQTKKLGLPDLQLNPTASDKKLHEKLEQSVLELQKKFPDFDSYPESAKIALMDMEYNMGSKFQEHRIDAQTGKDKGWPDFWKAVKEQDWDTAAEQSHRWQVGTDRNSDTATRFRKAKR